MSSSGTKRIVQGHPSYAEPNVNKGGQNGVPTPGGPEPGPSSGSYGSQEQKKAVSKPRAPLDRPTAQEGAAGDPPSG